VIGFVVVAAAPWTLSVMVRLWCRRVDRDVSPARAVVVLASLTTVAACSVTASLVAVAAVLLSSSTWPATVIGAAVILWSAWRAVLVVRHLRRVVASARRTARFGRVAARSDGVVVVETSEPDAFAVPSGGGAVVVTTGLLDALSDAEVRTVLDHERAHLRCRHALWTQAVEVSALLDPVLCPSVARVRHAVERHADECAAEASDRVTVMTALARAALLRGGVDRETVSYTVPGAGGDVVARALALSAPAPRPRNAPVIAAVAVVVVVMAMVIGILADVTQDVVAPESGETATSVLH
jgi:hypothetical protein